MADFVLPTEGANYIEEKGFPATVYFLLSTKTCTELGESATLAGKSYGGITGTGYTRKSQARPSPASRKTSFSLMKWETGSATDWPSNVKSVLAVSTNDDSGVILAAWNLQAGGTARDLSGANTTEEVTPVFSL